MTPAVQQWLTTFDGFSEFEKEEALFELLRRPMSVTTLELAEEDFVETAETAFQLGDGEETRNAPSGEQRLHQQALVCRLRKKTTGRAAHIPSAGEVELENVSANVLEIEIRTSPLQYLDLIVKDGTGQVVSESFYGDLFSPLEEPYTLRLRPGEKYQGPVGLLGNVPEARQRPGRYTVQGVFEYKGLRAASDPVPVEL